MRHGDPLTDYTEAVQLILHVGDVRGHYGALVREIRHSLHPRRDEPQCCQNEAGWGFSLERGVEAKYSPCYNP